MYELYDARKYGLDGPRPIIIRRPDGTFCASFRPDQAAYAFQYLENLNGGASNEAA